jgi:hypothetical protein
MNIVDRINEEFLASPVPGVIALVESEWEEIKKLLQPSPRAELRKKGSYEREKTNRQAPKRGKETDGKS